MKQDKALLNHFWSILLCGMSATVLIAALATAKPAYARGPFFSTLHDTFCKDQSFAYHKRQGCGGYLQYRIERGKSRDEAINKCNWGCGELYDEPSKVQACREGCAYANTRDK